MTQIFAFLALLCFEQASTWQLMSANQELSEIFQQSIQAVEAWSYRLNFDFC